MASFTAMQPLRRAVTQSRALQLRTLSYTAAIRAEARTGASSVSQRTTQSTGSSRGQNERDNQNRSSSRTPREGGPRNFEKRKFSQMDVLTAGNRPNVATPPGIAQLLDTLATLKEEGRKPTAAAYVALISAAADYDKRRGVSVGRGAKGAGLGFEIALAAARDAEAGGIELGQEAINEFLKVGHFLICLTSVLRQQARDPAISDHRIAEQVHTDIRRIQHFGWQCCCRAASGGSGTCRCRNDGTEHVAGQGCAQAPDPVVLRMGTASARSRLY